MKLPINYKDSHWTIRRQAREQYILEQDGKCCHCKKDIYTEPDETKPINKKLFPQGFFDYPIHLHHSHEDDGMTIGAVHAYCNAYLWQYLKE